MINKRFIGPAGLKVVLDVCEQDVAGNKRLNLSATVRI